MRRVTARDRRAFEALYQRYAGRLHRYLTRLIGNPEVTEEVLDDVMLVVWQSAGRFNYTSRVSTWIFGIAHHKSLKARARLSGQRAETPLGGDEIAEADGPLDATVRGEISRLVARELDALPAEQRAVMELTLYDDRSYREIAEITRSPINTVKTRMFHARKRLAPLLAALGPGPRRTPQESAG